MRRSPLRKLTVHVTVPHGKQNSEKHPWMLVAGHFWGCTLLDIKISQRIQRFYFVYDSQFVLRIFLVLCGYSKNYTWSEDVPQILRYLLGSVNIIIGFFLRFSNYNNCFLSTCIFFSLWTFTYIKYVHEQRENSAMN